ncbi:hypothetical protein [Natronincola ferrireducens]|uniref:Uncharacterized protein n=1 Tax=Natronincola ferrireducens TaxID=393762 RepID=A0A1G9C403_9FIRM|nr:hypothetical protein [Natronincola ferrireducens]SDK46346.1 hypothetical protein SAMN05660472_01355 [Natronincola ferrireducens]
MSIKPIDYHLTMKNIIYEAKDKHNDFNRIKETNAYLQNNEKIEFQRNKNRIKQTEETEGKKINNENKQQSKEQKKKSPCNRKTQDDCMQKESKSSKVAIDGNKGIKIDIFI